MPTWHSNFSNADSIYKRLNFLLQKTMGTCDEELKPLPPILSLSAQSPKEHHLFAQCSGLRTHKIPGRINHDIPKKCNFSNKQLTITMRKNKSCVSYSERIDGGEWVHGKAGDWQTCDGKVKHILITRARFCSQLSWSQEA